MELLSFTEKQFSRILDQAIPKALFYFLSLLPFYNFSANPFRWRGNIGHILCEYRSTHLATGQLNQGLHTRLNQDNLLHQIPKEK